EGVEVERDAPRQAELEAAAALAARVRVGRPVLGAAVDQAELRGREVGPHLGAGDVAAAHQVELHAALRVDVEDAAEGDGDLGALEAVVVGAGEQVDAQVEGEVGDGA